MPAPLNFTLALLAVHYNPNEENSNVQQKLAIYKDLYFLDYVKFY